MNYDEDLSMLVNLFKATLARKGAKGWRGLKEGNLFELIKYYFFDFITIWDSYIIFINPVITGI